MLKHVTLTSFVKCESKSKDNCRVVCLPHPHGPDEANKEFCKGVKLFRNNNN